MLPTAWTSSGRALSRRRSRTARLCGLGGDQHPRGAGSSAWRRCAEGERPGCPVSPGPLEHDQQQERRPGAPGASGTGSFLRTALEWHPAPPSSRVTRVRLLDGHVIVEFRSVAKAAGPCEIAPRSGGPEPRPPIHQSAAGGKHEQEVGHLVGRLSVPGSRAFAGFRRGRQGAGRGRAGGRTRGRAVGRSSGCRAGRKVQGGACAGRAGQGGQAAPGRAAAA